MRSDSPHDEQSDNKDQQNQLDTSSNRYLGALFMICVVAGICYGNTQFSELPTWKATLGGIMFGGFIGLCAVNYSRLNF